MDKTQKEPRSLRVVLRGRTYYLDAPLEFGPEDSGAEQARVLYTAAPGERVYLRGGRRLGNGRWGEIDGRKAWVVDIAKVKTGTWRFREPFVDGERRPRTILPKEGHDENGTTRQMNWPVNPFLRRVAMLLILATTVQAGQLDSLPKSTPAKGPLRVHPENPRYFMDGSGKAICLAGSHTWRNVQDSANVPNFSLYPGFSPKVWAQLHTSLGLPGKPGTPALTPTIYARTGPGKALDGGLKYDVSKFNQEFFDQLRGRCLAVQDRGIYVQVMLDSSVTARSEAPGNLNWPVHPYHSANNINGINGDPNGGQWGYEIFSLRSTPLTTLNENYAREVLDTLHDCQRAVTTSQGRADQNGDGLRLFAAQPRL